MTKLEQLIQEKCPNGVKYKKLQEVCGFITGFAFKANLFKDNGLPICKTTNIQNGYIDYSDMVKFNLSDYKENLDKYIINRDDIVIGMSGTIKVGINNNDDICYLNQRVGKFIPNLSVIDNKYLYYVICNSIDQLIAGIQGGSVKNLSNQDVLSFVLPVPPLEVQREIVEILDKFTLLTAELTAELTARKEQFEKYRDKYVLCEDKNTVNLENILKIKNGKDYKHLGSGNIPVYGTGGIMTYVNEYAYNKPSVLIPRKGSLDKVYYVDVPFWTVDTIFYTDIDIQKANPKYIFYCLQAKHLEKLNQAGGVPSLTQTVLNKEKIYLPDLKEQQRIVDILDRFDTLCNDISSGLPAEIEARQKQYEYYRDKLLNFKRLES